MIDDVLADARQQMNKAIKALQQDYAAMRTGRASTTLVNKLLVEYYGTPTALQELAMISVPEPQLIAIRPYDPGAIKDIERGIMQSDLGLNPNNDGKIIRLQIPPLTEERRRDLTKTVSKRAEEARISIRNARRDALDMLKALENDKDISEDDFHYGKDEVQKITNEFTEKVDELTTAKEKEIMEV